MREPASRPLRGPEDIAGFLHQVADAYAIDAYNSLSIEGYRVSADLIERVRAGEWKQTTSVIVLIETRCGARLLAGLPEGRGEWTVVPLALRDRYMTALESASVEQDIRLFADLLAELVQQSMPS